jgi:hypothetical protein
LHRWRGDAAAARQVDAPARSADTHGRGHRSRDLARIGPPLWLSLLVECPALNSAMRLDNRLRIVVMTPPVVGRGGLDPNIWIDVAIRCSTLQPMLVLGPLARAKGNPVRIRGCPAAVSENEVHDTH